MLTSQPSQQPSPRASRRPICRPRVEGDREGEILDACVELLHEVGYDRLTMDAVAKRAKASKATLYRRWETKPSLVTEALVRGTHAPHPSDHDTGSLRSDLISTFCSRAGDGPGSGNGEIEAVNATDSLGAVVTALCTDPEFAVKFRESFIEPKLAVLRAIYERAVARGEVDKDVDLEIIAPALTGILLHRMFVLGIPPDVATVERVVDHVILPAVRRNPS